MNILEKIVEDKRKEVALKKQYIPLEIMELLPHYQEKRVSLRQSLLQEKQHGYNRRV